MGQYSLSRLICYLLVLYSIPTYSISYRCQTFHVPVTFDYNYDQQDQTFHCAKCQLIKLQYAEMSGQRLQYHRKSRLRAECGQYSFSRPFCLLSAQMVLCTYSTCIIPVSDISHFTCLWLWLITVYMWHVTIQQDSNMPKCPDRLHNLITTEWGNIHSPTFVFSREF
jgi:hypothetical protein